jgi:membrane protease YdiL (CAAX protease family)
MIVLFIIYRKSIIEEFKIFKNDLKNNIKTGFKMWVIGLILMMFSNFIINVILFNGSIASNEELNRELISKFPVYSMISAIIFSPFIEELVFRKSFKDIIKNKNIYFILSGLLFGLAHALTEIDSIFDLLYIIPYGALGYAFAMAYDKTKSIFTSMFIHLVHNTFTLSLLIIFNNLIG